VSDSTIPTRIDELTADWLTESLRSSGVLDAARVTHVKAEALGDGEGFMGEIYRLHLVLDSPEPDTPATLIAKIPTNNRDNRAVGELVGAYDVAYFLSGALPADAPDGADLALVRDYHAALVTNGVEGYALEDCIRDYHRGLLAVLHRVSSTDTMDVGSDRGHDLFALWLERTLARLEGVDFDALLV